MYQINGLIQLIKGYCQCPRPYNSVHTVYMNVMFYILFFFYLCYLRENK